jgi:glycosyltransferase involved in cell wall biosynthesis
VTRALLEALTLVVPCYNEAKRFDVAKFSEALARFPGLQLLLVNDGSSDATAAVIEAFAAGAPGRVRTLSLPQNRGKAEAVRVGMQAAMNGRPLLALDRPVYRLVAKIPVDALQRDIKIQ